MKKLKIEIASPSDRDNLVAEIWYGDEMMAEINQEGEELELEIYAGTDGKWSLRYDEFLTVLETAQKQLTNESE